VPGLCQGLQRPVSGASPASGLGSKCIETLPHCARQANLRVSSRPRRTASGTPSRSLPQPWATTATGEVAWWITACVVEPM
jgi:hypothetical protein